MSAMSCSSSRKLLHFTLQTTRYYFLSTSAVSTSSVNCSQLVAENNAASSASGASNEPLATAKFSKIDLIKHEYEIWKHADGRMPIELLSRHVTDLLSLATPEERLQCLTSIGDSERLKEIRSAVKLVRRKAYDIMRDNSEESSRGKSYYGFGGNFLFQRIEKQLYMKWAIAHYAVHSLAAKFTVAYDFSLLEQCIFCDQKTTLKQVTRALKGNIRHRQPSQVLFTSFDRKSRWFTKWEGSTIFPIESDDLPTATIHQEHVTDLFPLDRIVYLSPDAVSVLNCVDEDKVYVIGAFEDASQPVPNATFAEAKKHAIPCYRLPIEKYVNWRCGSKSLQLLQVHQILLDYMMTNDWRTSFLNHIQYKNIYDRPENFTSLDRSLEYKVKRSELEYFNEQRKDFLLKLARVECGQYIA